MERGTLELENTGPFDLQSTVESGQSYLWWRVDGNDYQDETVYGGESWYLTTTREPEAPAVIRVRQHNGKLEWESTVDATPILKKRLRLTDDLDGIRAKTPTDPLIETAFEQYWGMRIVRDPTFPSLISFICSAQMHVTRIHEMQQALRETYGTPISFGDSTYYAYPTPAQLADATEPELRDLSLGYRAPYVKRTAEMVADGTSPETARDRSYEEARDYLTQFVGVGDKVADCVLLFALDFLEAVPLDTWIRKTIAEYYPGCDRGNYSGTSAAIRDRLGPTFAGYTQTYLFHYLRHAGEEAPKGPIQSTK